MKTQRLWMLVLILVLPACGGLQLNLLKNSVQKPSNISLYFSVETRDGMPVGGLEATSFRIYEDGQLISPFESKQTILNPEVAVVHHVLLLLDLSGSITESGSMHQLVKAAAAFTERMTKQRKVSVYAFDGRAKLIPLVRSTNNPAAVTRGLARLSSYKTKDPSTNLNGAVVASVQILERHMQASRQPVRLGTLVVFTDGTDRAHRVPEEKMLEALDQADLNVFAIGLGAEIASSSLSRIGHTGFVQAQADSDVGSAFNSVAESIEAASRKFYLLSYCSPSRAGTHILRVEANVEGGTGSLEQEFDAKGFSHNCDPKRPPRFSVGRVLLRRK
ncbi:MAG: VWA domain-containing protein [Deltaproteobacteria bacterium]|nr:VWA domain-containing protein [Deltaproteobacteria bacterium]